MALVLDILHNFNAAACAKYYFHADNEAHRRWAMRLRTSGGTRDGDLGTFSLKLKHFADFNPNGIALNGAEVFHVARSIISTLLRKL